MEAQVKLNKFYQTYSEDYDTDKEHKLPKILVDLKKADIFSLGVILFEMVVGISPFLNANVQDSYYRYFYFKKRCSQFWKIHPKAKDLESQGLLSDEFKDLIEQVLNPSPKLRLTLEEILAHPWMNL